jgi:diacylglycerol kinase
MICCVLIAGVLGLLGLPLAKLRPSPLGWRLPGDALPREHVRIARLKSFGYAFAGLRTLVREEPNARIHLVAATLAIVAGLVLNITIADWRWVVLSIGLVLAAECANTAVERTCDVASSAYHPLVKAAKDVAAGGVLLSALTALVIGAMTFWPYLTDTSPKIVLSLCSHLGAS